MKNDSYCSRRRGGFTLVEVLLVLVILVVLVSLAVPAYMKAQQKAFMNAAKAQIGSLEEALDMFQLDTGVFPSTLDALRMPPPDLPNPEKWNGPYLKKDLPLDPWGRPYMYCYPGRVNAETPDIWSLGPSGINGDPANVGNWN
jgi:general secretion pathway protein G